MTPILPTPELLQELRQLIVESRQRVAVAVNAELTQLYPFKTIRHDLEQLRLEGTLSPDLLLKDPYLLDFLGLNDHYLERDLEDAILRELEQFLLELGSGFSFVARQKRIQIDDDDFYIDLLELGQSGIHVAEYLTVLAL